MPRGERDVLKVRAGLKDKPEPEVPAPAPVLVPRGHPDFDEEIEE